MSFFGIKVSVLCFTPKSPRRICTNFLSGFRRKHLFVTTCIEKHCTRPL